MSQEFLWSIKNGEDDEVEEFINQKGFKVNEAIEGRYPIHYAADYGQTKVIEKLASNGAKIDVEDKYGITPLLNAIYEGHTDCVAYLLKKGADSTRKAPDGSSYIECAESEEIKTLLQKSQNVK